MNLIHTYEEINNKNGLAVETKNLLRLDWSRNQTDFIIVTIIDSIVKAKAMKV